MKTVPPSLLKQSSFPGNAADSLTPSIRSKHFSLEETHPWPSRSGGARQDATTMPNSCVVDRLFLGQSASSATCVRVWIAPQ